MRRYKIKHKTSYQFAGGVHLLPHTLRLRPREGHELRIESSILDISPRATIRWQRDAEGNSVALATFNTSAYELIINSEIVIQQYDTNPQDFLVADYAVNFPFQYEMQDRDILSPYMNDIKPDEHCILGEWMSQLWRDGDAVQTYTLLQKLNQLTYQSLKYVRRDQEGVQSPEMTLSCGTGSCRDSANLFMWAARYFGFASRFVSGYVHSPLVTPLFGATHAWVEVFIPGAGWKGFDPSTGNIVGAEHISTSVARLAESVPPISGNYIGSPGAAMSVNVSVTEI